MMQAGREDWGVARRLCMKLREPVINGDDLFGDPDPPGLPGPVLVVAGCSLLWLNFRHDGSTNASAESVEKHPLLELLQQDAENVC
jgi:hypothetical protein